MADSPAPDPKGGWLAPLLLTATLVLAFFVISALILLFTMGPQLRQLFGR